MVTPLESAAPSRAALSIWTVENRLWPKASDDYIFLGDAFNEVGQSRFGANWTGDEAKRTLEQVVSGDERLERCWQSAAWIADRARNGRLKTYGLLVAGGESPVLINAAIWNRADDWELFASCRITKALPPRYVEADYYLFLATNELRRELSPPQPGALAPGAVKPTSAPEPPQHRARGGGGFGISTPGISKPTKKPRGRRRGVGGYRAEDEAIARKIRAAKLAGDNRAPSVIARDFEHEIKGSREADKHLRRVAEVYWELYPQK
jgi:hypothetical protein